MKVKDLVQKTNCEVINEGDFEREVGSVYCCDLLSWVMGRAPADSAWFTVMGNMNAIAVAVLADISAVILVEGAAVDQPAIAKAIQQNINILRTNKTAFEAALQVHECIN
ncbi:MAG: hypothetical protein LBC82_09185 [Oscillospiraceae bacterium]|jgi:hypothetical protein|nr:hypothetical protein [Oscillospiraceae bacterium]